MSNSYLDYYLNPQLTSFNYENGNEIKKPISTLIDFESSVNRKNRGLNEVKNCNIVT